MARRTIPLGGSPKPTTDGNRSAQTALANTCVNITCPQPSVAISATTNRLFGPPYTYDFAGNMTNDGINTLVYDAENHVTSATNGGSSGAYVYDGNGLRVQRCVPNCTSPTTSTVYLFSGSKVIAEYDNGAAVGSPSREYVYAGGALLGKIDSSGTEYYHQDHLSNRLITDSNGNTLIQQGHFPYGENWYAEDGSGNNVTPDKWQFTTYERDSESGNDYAQARYSVSGLARFNSPDPITGSTSDPQSLNPQSLLLCPQYASPLHRPGRHMPSNGSELGSASIAIRRIRPRAECGQRRCCGPRASTRGLQQSVVPELGIRIRRRLGRWRWGRCRPRRWLQRRR
jgi:RHS repeat-associated protein